VAFSDFKNFHGRRIARKLESRTAMGQHVPLSLKVTKLEDLKSGDETLFAVATPTAPEKQLRVAGLRNEELLADVIGSREIVWPQPLDNGTKGKAGFFVSVDREGRVREAVPLFTPSERSNEPAVNQLKRWRFKPFVVDGVPVQAEGVVAFDVDTRKFGPAEALNNEEARKLVTGIFEPKIKPGSYPAGTVYKLWVAIDTDGHMIEAGSGGGPLDLWDACYGAARQWQFHPIVKNGQALPYRAVIEFKAP
jgi:hypothetical protein